MKSLIAYYSHSGNNEKLAYYLKDKLKCSIYKITEVKKRKTISILADFLFKRSTKLIDTNLSTDEFDIVILVSPIWGSTISTPIRMFLEKEKENIKRFGFISFCNGESGQKEKLIKELTYIVGKAPAACTELSINELLPADKQNQIKYTFHYRISGDDLMYFKDKIEGFYDELIMNL